MKKIQIKRRLVRVTSFRHGLLEGSIPENQDFTVNLFLSLLVV